DGQGSQHAQRERGSAKQGHGPSAVSPATSAAQSGSEAESPTEARRKHERAAKPSTSHVARGKAKEVETARPTKLTSEPASSPSTSSAPESVSPASLSTPAASIPTAATEPIAKASQATGAAPSIARRSPQGKSSKAHRRSRAASTHSTAVSREAGGAGAAVAAAPVSLVSAVVHKATKPQAKHSSPVRSSPLATTITRIVGVVPTPIKILIGLLVALALAMAARNRLTDRRARRLERQRGELLEDVGLLQAALLPITPPRLGPVGTSAAYRPAEGPAAGGDFYDVFALEDGKIAVIVGDVSGHGRKALPHTALVRFTLRAYLEAGLSPRGAVQTAGAVLERQLGNSFATVVAATYNPRERRLVYASAGHPPPIVRGCEPESQPLEPVTACSSPPLGVGMATGVRQSVVDIPGSAQICFFTDGVTEARVGTELYGSQRLAEALAELGPQASADELLDSVSRSADRRPDDMAACVLHVEGSQQPPVAVLEELELDRELASSDRGEEFLRACGVGARDAAEAMHAARAAAERSGSVVLQLRRGGEVPEVSFQQDNLAYLQTRHAARQADVRLSV
ncbi:MAG TPA: SpoIIE family protein phosphatase, partial [Solirubrobacteraceae bacterium]|nr:SpoIIE family protein phosphatase [Solirubrobacteraceae bacterium]